ncbi:hypothetical protein LCGC14_0389220 [marine sediment metagenome]|uniref:histidine kinase n=1 Tax=marine sediment metagenome TaxID=412755 RepID=A0A0F9VM84_9ZZZZ|nr:HAMP domain-containing protein [Phycisphaerae bacterium]HDZ43893.1 HAMP domain-containing protein [Phycisphaerae bacterium]
MFHLSLRTKIMICCIGLVALLDIMVVVFVRSRLSTTLRAECLTKGQNLACHLAARSEHLVLTEEVVSLQRLVQDLEDSDEDVTYAYVTDRKGRVLAHTFAHGFPSDLAGVNVPQPDDAWRWQVLETEEEGLIHDVAVPMLRGKAGAVHVGVTEKRIHRTIAHFTGVIVIMSALVLLIAFGLAALVSWVVTQPVRSLTKAARKIRDGDLGEQVVATTKDEIGDLVESFNQMSAELLKQHKVLADRNRRIRMAQEQAEEQRNKLRAIIDSMVEGVVFVDAEGRISLCNESAERIWGVAAQDLLNKPLLDCHPPQARARVAEILERAKARPGYAVTREMACPKGHYRLSNYSSVHGQGGRYLGLVLLTQDISERVLLEQGQKALRDQLFQQEKMVLIGQIAASVAHEVNTPLATILLRTHLVRRQIGDDGSLPDLDVIAAEAQRCRRIIDSLLGFARRSEGVRARMNVNVLIRKSLALIEHDLVLKGIALEAEYASDGALAPVDADQIQQVLLNLVTNAADAMPDGGRLRITTWCPSQEDTVKIQIIDDGCGMGPDVLDRAFDPFFTTKEPGKGTGLGLAICQRIVEEHEGQIDIDSQPGQGTTVSISLPRAPVEVTTSD